VSVQAFFYAIDCVQVFSCAFVLLCCTFLLFRSLFMKFDSVSKCLYCRYLQTTMEKKEGFEIVLQDVSSFSIDDKLIVY